MHTILPHASALPPSRRDSGSSWIRLGCIADSSLVKGMSCVDNAGMTQVACFAYCDRHAYELAGL